MTAPTAARATDVELANAIRALAMDAVEAAKSGHPGMPMGMAEIAVALWNRHLRHNPANPQWPDRDRFVLSNGHGSMLQYALLHLTGYDLPIGELRNFRQLHSKTPGHPEVGVTPGVETTTGPLGQGLANAVGMALAEALLAREFNRPGHAIVDHRTYVFVGDGCLMEGISHEACSLAGTLGLGKLIAFYDDNGISIDGHVAGWFTDDTPQRFAAYGWHVIANVDGHDVAAVDAAIARCAGGHRSAVADLLQDDRSARARRPRPAPRPRTAPRWAKRKSPPRAPRSAGRIRRSRFPRAIYATWSARECGALLEADWNARFAAYRAAYPELAAEFERRMAGDLPADFRSEGRGVRGRAGGQGRNGRHAQGVAAGDRGVREAAARDDRRLGRSHRFRVHQLVGQHRRAPVITRGNYVNFGVREFAMSAIANGLALHGGFIPYVGTFLTFSDYARNALRMAALMKLRTIFVYTHDSIGLGEDGPTHQSVEHAASAAPHPGNGRLAAVRHGRDGGRLGGGARAQERADRACCSRGRTCRSSSATTRRSPPSRRGGYVLADFDAALPARARWCSRPDPKSRSALAARDALAKDGVDVRVVSMPCTAVFDRQDAAYRESVLPRGVPRVAVEAGVTDFWRKYVGAADDPRAAVVGIDTFGESAPAPVLFKHFGFTPERVVAAVRKCCKMHDLQEFELNAR